MICPNCGSIEYEHYASIYRCNKCGYTWYIAWFDPPEIKKTGVNTMTKIEQHKKLCDSLNDLYARKNADYGDSFHLSFKQEGMAMPRIRLGDKYNRFCALTRGSKRQVNDESVRDTLIDLANYALMTVLELDNGAWAEKDN